MNEATDLMPPASSATTLGSPMFRRGLFGVGWALSIVAVLQLSNVQTRYSDIFCGEWG